MPRKVAFSCKQKKKQLQEKKLKKKDGPKYLADQSDSDSDNETETSAVSDVSTAGASHSTVDVSGSSQGEVKTLLGDFNVQKINQQPQTDYSSITPANSFRLHFFKESDEVVNRRKKDARRPVKQVDEKYLEYKMEDVYPANTCLDFPKRPPWSYRLSKEKLEEQEQLYFNNYLQEVMGQPRAQDLSYFELNLQTWRQLWRVLEISDLLLVIADIRYPVLHVSPSLVSYVTEELHKQVVIILNKIDFVPTALAVAWKRYIQARFPGVPVVFFSSFPRDVPQAEVLSNFDPSKGLYKHPFQGKYTPVGPAELLSVCQGIVKDKVDLSGWEEMLEDSNPPPSTLKDPCDGDGSPEGDVQSSQASDSREEACNERQSLSGTPSATPQYKDGVLTIGCIGYPNVGKSSVLNALVKRKVVSVSQTPGHTKHLQTIFLCPTVKLCDCPGLVFPSMVPKSLQVVAGIFPVAQVREPYSVVAYLAKRLDLPALLSLTPPNSSPKKRDKNTSRYIWSAMDICDSWALKNGFRTSKAGRPDVYRAANKILRLAVEGQLCLSFRPPSDHLPTLTC